MIIYENDNCFDAVNKFVTFDILQKIKKFVYANVKKLKYDIVILRSIFNRKIGEFRKVDIICNCNIIYKAMLNENS